MARPKSASHDLRREAILDIAAQCFADSSYPAASMNDIAQAGGTSKARLYHYYESKEAILFDLLDRYAQQCWLSCSKVIFLSARSAWLAKALDIELLLEGWHPF